MLRGSLFWRFFSAILAAMLVVAFLMVGITGTTLGQERQRAYEAEVRLQAQEIADYMSNLN